jgi:hypothetical protein
MVKRKSRGERQGVLRWGSSECETAPQVCRDQREPVGRRCGLNRRRGRHLLNRDRDRWLAVDDGVLTEEDGFSRS